MIENITTTTHGGTDQNPESPSYPFLHLTDHRDCGFSSDEESRARNDRRCSKCFNVNLVIDTIDEVLLLLEEEDLVLRSSSSMIPVDDRFNSNQVQQ